MPWSIAAATAAGFSVGVALGASERVERIASGAHSQAGNAHCGEHRSPVGSQHGNAGPGRRGHRPATAIAGSQAHQLACDLLANSRSPAPYLPPC
jgi:hypothetical protein